MSIWIKICIKKHKPCADQQTKTTMATRKPKNINLQSDSVPAAPRYDFRFKIMSHLYKCSFKLKLQDNFGLWDIWGHLLFLLYSIIKLVIERQIIRGSAIL